MLRIYEQTRALPELLFEFGLSDATLWTMQNLTTQNLTTQNLNGYKVAVLATDGFEESELTVPVRALLDAGAKVHVISPSGKKIQGFKHYDRSIRIDSDRKLDEIRPSEYDAVLLPGGALNADALRTEPRAQEFIRAMNNGGKPIAVICHGAWLLVSADVVRNRQMTSWPSIADDIRNAGGKWEDQEVLVDRNLISSRKPADLPAFCEAMINVFSNIGILRGTVAA